jgi:hypothetical protein
MTNSRDSSGGYLTGDESERLWDRDEEDAYTAELLGDGRTPPLATTTR